MQAETTTADLFLLEDLDDPGRTHELADSDVDALKPSQTGSQHSSPSRTTISAATDPSAPSSPGHWSATSCGSPVSTSPTGPRRMLPSS
jgi:hypothetical protein